jgi:hypothetical protein
VALGDFVCLMYGLHTQATLEVMQLVVKVVVGGDRDRREAQQECDDKTSTGHLLGFRMNYIQIHRIPVWFHLNLLVDAKS